MSSLLMSRKMLSVLLLRMVLGLLSLRVPGCLGSRLRSRCCGLLSCDLRPVRLLSVLGMLLLRLAGRSEARRRDDGRSVRARRCR